MKSNQQKSFRYTEGHARYESPYKVHYSVSSHSYSSRNFSGAAIIWALRKVSLLIERFLVLVKYQFYKNTAVAPSTVRVPVLKLGIVGLLAFAVFKQDLTLSLGHGKERAQFGQPPALAEDEIPPEGIGDSRKPKRSFVSLFEKKDYFADSPDDDEEARMVKAYVRRYKHIAVAEMEKFGIPASIKMAQAIVESNSGNSPLARKNNNHFGIKCFSRTCKKGHCSNFGDDSHKDFFRKYASTWESFRAHSHLIVTGKYKTLLKYGNDYERWARGLKELGYATASKYDETLIKMIEKYHLDELDK